MNQYIENNLVQMTVAITTPSGTAVDPTAITLRIQTPDGVVTDVSGTVVHASTGNYYANYLPIQVGLHQYEWTGTGAAQVVAQGQFLINQATF